MTIFRPLETMTINGFFNKSENHKQQLLTQLLLQIQIAHQIYQWGFPMWGVHISFNDAFCGQQARAADYRM